MEPEKDPSLSVQKTSVPLALLGILGFSLSAWIFSKLKTPTNDSRQSNHEHNTTQQQPCKPQPPGHSERVSTEIHFRPEDVNRYYSESHKAYRLNRKVFWVSFGTLLGLLAYTVVTYCLLRQTKRSADTAQEVAHIASNQLELSERPWVNASIYLDGPLSFNQNGALLPLKWTLTNTGNSPALYTSVEALVFIDRAGANTNADRMRTCDAATMTIAKFPNDGVALFPKTVFIGGEKIGIGKEDIRKGADQYGGGNYRNFIVNPAVIVCVAYKAQFAKARTYHTAYSFQLFKMDSLNRPGIFFNVGQNIDERHLRLQLVAFGGIAAD